MNETDDDRDMAKRIFGGTGAIGLAFILSIVGQSDLDLPLTISLYVFAAILPLCLLMLLVVSNDKLWARFEENPPWYVKFSAFLSLLGGFIGIAGIFWHFSWFVGVLFIVVGVFGLAAFFRFDDQTSE